MNNLLVVVAILYGQYNIADMPLDLIENKTLKVIVKDVKQYYHKKKVKFKVTSYIRPLHDGISKTRVHQSGRAVDISIRGLSRRELRYLKRYITKKYNHYGAFSYRTYKPVVIHIHNVGHGWHAHIQVRRGVHHGINNRCITVGRSAYPNGRSYQRGID